MGTAFFVFVIWNEKPPVGQIQKFLENFLRNLRVILNLLDMLTLNDSSSSNFDSYGLELGSLERALIFYKTGPENQKVYNLA